MVAEGLTRLRRDANPVGILQDSTEATPQQDRIFALTAALLSLGAVGFLGWLLMAREGGTDGTALGFLPGVNATFNGLACGCLVAGLASIRAGEVASHRLWMMAAFFCSALFLVGYVVYHYVHGDTRYGGEGVLRTVYLIILASHVVLSIVVFPMILTTFYLSLTKRFRAHRRIARITLPLWLYVSVTGVVVYFMLHVFR